MAYEVILTDEFRQDLKGVIDYLKSEWSEKAAGEFAIRCINRIEILFTLPFIGQASKKDKRIRKIIITKHNSLYYSIDGNKIVLLNLFDTRQNPMQNPYQ